MAVALLLTPVVIESGMTWAACNPDTHLDENGKKCTPPPETSILPNDWGIEDLLGLVLKVIVYGLGVAAVLGVVIAGVMYMTARDNEAQVTKAKTRLYEVVIGLIAWAVMFAVLNWLIPGSLDIIPAGI